MRNFTPPEYLPAQTYGCSKWYIATLPHGSKGYARFESIGGVDTLMVYARNGAACIVCTPVTLLPEYTTDIDWSTFDAAFERGSVTFAKE